MNPSTRPWLWRLPQSWADGSRRGAHCRVSRTTSGTSCRSACRRGTTVQPTHEAEDPPLLSRLISWSSTQMGGRGDKHTPLVIGYLQRSRLGVPLSKSNWEKPSREQRIARRKRGANFRNEGSVLRLRKDREILWETLGHLLFFFS